MASLLLFLMVVFVILTTCAHVYFENTILTRKQDQLFMGLGFTLYQVINTILHVNYMIQISWGRSPVYSMILFDK